MFDFKIIPDMPGAEPFQVTAGMRDIRLWEKTHPKRSVGQLSDAANLSATILFELANAACRRQGLLVDNLTDDQFADAYEIDLLEDEDESDSEVTQEGDPTP